MSKGVKASSVYPTFGSNLANFADVNQNWHCLVESLSKISFQKYELFCVRSGAKMRAACTSRKRRNMNIHSQKVGFDTAENERGVEARKALIRNGVSLSRNTTLARTTC